MAKRNYIDKELGIRSVVGLSKYLVKQTNADVEAVKLSGNVRVFWAVNNKLHTHDIPGSVIYVIQLHEVQEAIEKIKSTLEW